MLLTAAARAVLGGGRGSLADQLDRRPAAAALPPPLTDHPADRTGARRDPATPPEGLRFWNGYGGFRQDGREYVILIDGTAPGGPALPPAPWTNVLANPGFGCLVTEAGLGYSWAGNSQMNRLTPWSNDPVSDPPGEVVYLRDEETGAVVDANAPCREGPVAAVTVRHGQGYTRYSRRSHGLEQELLVLVPPDDPVKLVCLSVRNAGDRPRRLSATFYAEWVLGSVRDNAPLQVVCERDAESGAVLARNAWAGDFAGWLAFAAVGSAAALRHRRPRRVPGPPRLAGRAGRPRTCWPVGPRRAGARPVRRALDADRARSRPGGGGRLRLGTGGDVWHESGSSRLLTPSPVGPRRRCQEVQRLWDRILGAVQVTTPDAGLDLMVNRWLLYQVLACRVWGRSAFYQSGGAYGFRDQLQDVMALVYSAPEEARAQILRSAGTAVRGRRRAALVAPAVRPRRPHPHHRRPVLPAAGRPPLRHRDRRRRPARRAGAVPEVAGAAARPGGGLRPAGGERADGDASTSTASAPWSTATGSDRTACR